MPFLSLIFIYKRFSFCYLFKCSKFSGAQNSCTQNFGAQISCAWILTLGFLASFLKEPQYLKRISSAMGTARKLQSFLFIAAMTLNKCFLVSLLMDKQRRIETKLDSFGKSWSFSLTNFPSVAQNIRKNDKKTIMPDREKLCQIKIIIPDVFFLCQVPQNYARSGIHCAKLRPLPIVLN